ncbi:hypothetical protein ACFT25_15770 [Streptomyces hydrogenans]|uniref:hypothetical protein n=1 Tax=Streptomyces hydrogenans TaxID=1873719 RepID=UPI0036389D8F
MSWTRQAFLLGRHLTEVTGVEVTLEYVSGAEWSMIWPDGPLYDEMRAHLDEALAGYRYADMRDGKITPLRGDTSRSWAAQAIASRREGTLAAATCTDQHGRRLRHLSEHDMARVLLAVELAPARDQPPRLAVIPAKEEA